MYDRNLNLVIFSSGEQMQIALRIASTMNRLGYKCHTWCDLFSRKDETANYALLPTLLKKIPTFDFSIIIGGADDIVEISRRGDKEIHRSMRDNVIFELGLSIMALGQHRTVLVVENNVRLFDDLIGVSGVYGALINEKLTIGSLGIKSFGYDNFHNQFEQIIFQLNEYMQQYIDLYNPIVIGAACSTAIGYYEMFVKRLIDSFLMDQTLKSSILEVNILIPNQINECIHQQVNAYYKKQGLSSIQLHPDGERPISFSGRQNDNRLIVFDIPTTIGTSYATASTILSLHALDVDDPDDKLRFLQKEVDIFFHTLIKLTNNISIKNVSIKINRIKLS